MKNYDFMPIFHNLSENFGKNVSNFGENLRNISKYSFIGGSGAEPLELLAILFKK